MKAAAILLTGLALVLMAGSFVAGLRWHDDNLSALLGGGACFAIAAAIAADGLRSERTHR